MKTHMVLGLLWLLWLIVPGIVDAKTMYTRPLSSCANNGDGTAYACAASPGAVGAYSNLGGVAWGVGANQVGNGDTLYICGFHDGGNDGVRTDHSLTPTTSPIIDGNCPSDPGTILSNNHKWSSGWTGPDAFGAYSRADGGCSSMHMVQLVNGVPTRLPYPKTAVPDASWLPGSFYSDCAGNYYVKPLNGVSANATTLYTTWTGIFPISNVTVTIQNLTLYGLSNFYCIDLSNADNSVVTNTTIKWCAFAAVATHLSSDGVRITNNTISQSGNGIYTISSTTANNSDNLVVTDNTITDLDQQRVYAAFTSDNHGIGIQGGDDSVYSRNTIDGVAGTCITFYSDAGQSMKRNTISSNRCKNSRDLSGLSPLRQDGIENGSTNSGHVANDVVDNEVFGNVLENITMTCFTIKASQPSIGAPLKVFNNTAVNCGEGLSFEDFEDGNIGFIFRNNVLKNATINIDHIQNGTDTLTNIVINNNIYTTDGSTLFEWNGTKSNFASWKTNSSQDAASSVTDPLFVSSTDFRLQAGSSLRRAGTWMSKLCTDVRSRPCWTPPDIGGYQATSGDPAVTRSVRIP